MLTPRSPDTRQGKRARSAELPPMPPPPTATPLPAWDESRRPEGSAPALVPPPPPPPRRQQVKDEPQSVSQVMSKRSGEGKTRRTILLDNRGEPPDTGQPAGSGGASSSSRASREVAKAEQESTLPGDSVDDRVKTEPETYREREHEEEARPKKAQESHLGQLAKKPHMFIVTKCLTMTKNP